MQFLIPIRNSQTGEEKSFADKQGIADFLASREDAADWDVSQLGELPAPTDPAVVEVLTTTVEEAPVEPVAATPAAEPEAPAPASAPEPDPAPAKAVRAQPAVKAAAKKTGKRR